MKKVEIVKGKIKIKKEAKMKKPLTLLMLVVPMFIFAQADAGVAGEEVTVDGEVVEVGEVLPPGGEVNVVQARIKTQNQEMIQAQLGPKWFLNDEIEVGDKLKLQGALKQNNLQVKTMIRDTNRYNIRNEEGEPLWVRKRLQEKKCIYNPVKEKAMKGKIEELYLTGETQNLEARVQTGENERVRVQLGPEWFLRNRVRVGDEIEFRGSDVDFDGGQMLLVREMKNLRNKEELKLRNKQGFPQWAGGEGEQLQKRIQEQKRDGSQAGEMQQKRLNEEPGQGKGR
ncbi:MAG: hypothetical protein P8Z50_00120 [candidate division WOR-3 bacterium]|jgi:hypothetical protein